MQKQRSFRLYQAIQNQDLAKIEEYVAAGDDLTEIDQVGHPGFSLLDLAASLGRSDIVHVLLNAGIPVDYSHESSPLHQAVSEGHLETARVLINAGANLEFESDDGITPLIEAVERRNLAMVRLLVESGANAEATDRNGNSALQYAAHTEDEIFQYLANRIQTKNQQFPKSGKLVRCCVEAIRAGNLNLLKTLIAQGIDVDARDNEGYTLLMNAAFYGQLKIVKYLIKLGADVNAIRSGGTETPLKYAAQVFDWKSVDTLLSAGADVNATHGGSNALIYAAVSQAYGGNKQRSRIKTIEVLLDAGAQILIKENFTLLDWARQKSDQTLLRLLKRQGY